MLAYSWAPISLGCGSRCRLARPGGISAVLLAAKWPSRWCTFLTSLHRQLRKENRNQVSDTSLPTLDNPSKTNNTIAFLTLPGFLLLQLLLLVLNGFYLCIVDLGKLVPVGPVVVQAVEHGLDLLVEPGELLVEEGQERPWMLLRRKKKSRRHWLSVLDDRKDLVFFSPPLFFFFLIIFPRQQQVLS